MNRKEKRITDDQQQQHIQQAVKLYDDEWPLKGAINLLGVVFAKFSIFINLYFPGYLPGQELAPSSKLKGCQRVIEPDLSPLLYKPKYAQCGN